jgi:ubiquinone/menaquinone biosynthesis C-methylase UbiE
MANEYSVTRWSAVDQATDPSAFVSYLDTVATLETVRRIKQRTYELLQVRVGHHLLDVGCGLGDDVRALAQQVGTAGRVVGVDSSETMIAEARKRLEGMNLPVEFFVGEAQHLEFADNTFDGCRAERIFLHLNNPSRALAEMVRVARAGAQLVVFDGDWETLVFDVPAQSITRRLLNFLCDSHGSGWIGRQLRGLFLAAGLTEVRVFADTLMFTDYTQANQVFNLQETVIHAQAAGVVSPTDVNRWLNHLEEANQAGKFFAAVTGFFVSGRKP